MRRAIAAVVGAVAVVLPVEAAAAAVAKSAPKVVKRVVTVRKRVAGTQGDAGQWGTVEVTLLVRKTTTTIGSRKTVKRRIVSVGVPVYPDHTGRSIFINQQALPILEQEVLQAQFNANVEMVSGATYTSNGFVQSLQAALLAAKRV
jgi:uncharacterized protein with FMN-binding domain